MALGRGGERGHLHTVSAQAVAEGEVPLNTLCGEDAKTMRSRRKKWALLRFPKGKYFPVFLRL